MNHDLLDLVGNIDERYIEEASGKLLRERKRTVWPAVAAAIILVIAGISGGLLLRHGLLRAQKPGGNLAASSADPASVEETDPTEPMEDRNALDIDFDSAIGGTGNGSIAFACRYAQSLAPSKKNEMTGLFAGKNLILITAQNFSPRVIDPERTPTLYRLATKGIEFTDYYQPSWGGAASTGEFAILTGLVPANGVQSMKDSIGKNMAFTLGNQLRRRGYFSRAYCDDHSYDYYHRDLTHPNFGYEELLGIGNGLDLVLTEQWPYSDREMMGVVVDQVLEQQPFSVYCMMCSGQGAYFTHANELAEQHLSEVEDLPYSDTVRNYLAANLEVELALRDLVDALEHAGIADDTVIVLTSSQYPYALEKNEDYGNDEDYLAELYGKPVESCFERDRSTLILWSGCLEGKNYKVTPPTSSLDIVPTLSNLFGMEFDSRLLVGRDVFSDQNPLVLWPDGSWKTDKGQYDAQTGLFTPAEGANSPADYAETISQDVETRIAFSRAMLEQDLLSILLPEKDGSAEPDDGWRPFPAADPTQVVRDALSHESEKAYVLSLTIEEVRLDEAEKQKLLAGDLDCETARRGGFSSLDGMLMEELSPKKIAVVYARYRVDYAHTKTSSKDGLLDQYFFLVRDEDGNWGLYTISETRELPDGE